MQFQILEENDLSKLITKREGEIKLGEKIELAKADLLSTLKESQSLFVLFGIPEDIGPRANCGRGGADSTWKPFLAKFLNIQSTQKLSGEEILLLGNFDFSGLVGSGSSDLEKLRTAVSKIDEQVSSLVKLIVEAGKIPILIGGGHNNSYGALKGCSEALKQKINCINLDPHADYRNLEGRHSGNGFSYAKAEGYLDHYSILGLHENYNSQAMLEQMQKDGVQFSFYEDLFLRNNTPYYLAVENALAKVKEDYFGVELDCDSIENLPSSAQTPSGIRAKEARQYLTLCGESKNACYLHLPEAAPSLVEGFADQVGKLLSYFVSDFVKAKLNTLNA
ncbi:MAG: formimidoylglutamase [Vicingaceae bacterium]